MLSWLRNSGKACLSEVVFRDRFAWRLPAASGRAIALTFDDGPDPEFTPAVLALLAREDVPATFFMIGRHVQRAPGLAREVAAAGHTLAAHGYAHRVIVGLPAADLARELADGRQAIADATGIDTPLYRPPRGRMSLGSLRAVCGSGHTLVHWSRTYADYLQDGAEALLARMRAAPPAARDIVLLHDHNAHTVTALARMIPRWRDAGFTFRAL